MHPHAHGPGCGCGEPDVLKKAEEELPGAKVFYRDRPMRQLHEGIYRGYEYIYRRMLVAMKKYIEDAVIVGDMFQKSDIPPRLLTPAQLQEIRKIVLDYHDAFIAGTLGPGVLPPGVAQQLIDAGILPQDLNYMAQPSSPRDLPPKATKMIQEAYAYGAAMGAIGLPTRKKELENLSYQEWKERPPIPLTPAEKNAVNFAEHAAADRIKGLGNRVAQDFTSKVIEGDKTLRRRFEDRIRDRTAENIEKRETWRKLWSELGHDSDDWSRDLGRIAATEKMDAMLDGQARAIVKRSPGGPEEVRVAKQPNPGACKDCIRLYTQGGKPRIFTMAELQDNGSNIGRKREDWVPTLGPAHPWCSCELIEVPSGWEFDENNDLIPSMLKRSDFEWNLCKSVLARRRVMTYGDSVGDSGLGIRVADPKVRAAVEEVVLRTPQQIFSRATGVTLITTDHGRPQTALQEQDLAYWVGNEIRLQQTIDPRKVRRVLEHELGHALNSWLLTKLGDIEAVKGWHSKLWEVSEREGFVTKYAKMEPIENAAEVTRLYLYYPEKLRKYPRQFAMCHKAYGDLISAKVRPGAAAR